MFQHSPHGSNRCQAGPQASCLPVRPSHASTQSLHTSTSHIVRSLPRVSTSPGTPDFSPSSYTLPWSPSSVSASTRADASLSAPGQGSINHAPVNAKKQRHSPSQKRTTSPAHKPLPVNRPTPTSSPHPSRAPPQFRNKSTNISARQWVPNPPPGPTQAWVDWVATHASASLQPSIVTKALRAFSAKPHSDSPPTATLLDSIHSLLKICSELEASNPELVLDQAARSLFLQQHLHSHPKCFNATLQLLTRAASSSRTFDDPISISQLAVAQVRLGVTCPLFWERLAGEYLHNVAEYPMEQIANLTWAAAKLDVPLPPPFAAALRGAALRVLPACNPRNVTTLLWAYASSAPLRRPSNGAAPRNLRQAPVDAWSTDEDAWGTGDGPTAHGGGGAAGSVPSRGPERPSAVPSRWRGSLEGSPAQGTQQGGVGAAGEEAHVPECALDELCDALVDTAQQRAAEMVPRGLSTCLWAIAALGRPQDRAAAAGVAERALGALPELNARGTANVAWACARLEVPLTDAQAATLADRAVHFCKPYMHERKPATSAARIDPAAHPEGPDAFTALGFANTVWALGTLGIKRSCSFANVAAGDTLGDDRSADKHISHSAGSRHGGSGAAAAGESVGAGRDGNGSVSSGAEATPLRAARARQEDPVFGQSGRAEGEAPQIPVLDAHVRADPEQVAELLGAAEAAGVAEAGPAHEREMPLAPLLAATRRLLPQSSVAELVSSCTGLSKLGVRFSQLPSAALEISLPAAEQVLLMKCVARHVTEFSAIEIAAVLASCSRLGIPWGVQQDALLATFVLHATMEGRAGHTSDSDADEAATRVPPQATANVVWAAARGRGSVFGDDDTGALRGVLENAVQKFNGQEIANVLWALGVGGHRVEGRLARLLQTTARDTVATMSAQELACTCGGLVKTGLGLGLSAAVGDESVWEVDGGNEATSQRRGPAPGEAVATEIQGAIERLGGVFTPQTAAHVGWAIAESGAVLTQPAALRSLGDAVARTAAEAAQPMEAAVMLHSAAAMAAAAAAAPQRAQRAALLDPQGELLRRLCAAVDRTAAAAPAVAVLCSLRALLRLSRLPAAADGGAAAALAPGGAGAAAVTALRHGVARHAADLSWRDSEDAAEALVLLGEGVPDELVACMCDSSEEEGLSGGESDVFMMDDMELASAVSET